MSPRCACRIVASAVFPSALEKAAEAAHAKFGKKVAEERQEKVTRFHGALRCVAGAPLRVTRAAPGLSGGGQSAYDECSDCGRRRP